MFDIAWSEMMLIGAVALVVIKPKDLPGAMRACGEAVGKIKRMAAEFQGQFNDAMRAAEVDQLKKQVEEVGGTVQAATKVDFNPIQTIREEIKGVTATGAAAGAAAASTTQASTLEASTAQASATLPEPVIPLPDPPPPVNLQEFVTPAVAEPAAEAPAEEPKPKRARKPKSADAEGGAA
jgi:sec-independent protein translocase protein TatB